jgi:hypothetical protein
MSLLSSFVAGHLVTILETEFAAHEPEVQQLFLNEVIDFSEALGGWLSSKMKGVATAAVEPAAI